MPSPNCPKYSGTGSYRYDKNHSNVCCPHYLNKDCDDD